LFNNPLAGAKKTTAKTDPYLLEGVGFFQGVISEVSRFSICLTDLAKKLNWKAKIMTVVVSGQGKNFKMSASL
jgi:sRNA-binding regulator protein Hfq